MIININTDLSKGMEAFTLLTGYKNKADYPKRKCKGRAWGKLKEEYERETITSSIDVKTDYNSEVQEPGIVDLSTKQTLQ